jgi:hypothetical protein
MQIRQAIPEVMSSPARQLKGDCILSKQLQKTMRCMSAFKQTLGSI